MTYFWRAVHALWQRIRVVGHAAGMWRWTGGRRYDFTPSTCPHCGKVTPSRWLKHGYGVESRARRKENGEREYEITYTAHCPKCGALVWEV